ncbi:MAG TPA: zinc-ribbon domain-containing protein [Tepidisphaeraceae bacterium]
MWALLLLPLWFCAAPAVAADDVAVVHTSDVSTWLMPPTDVPGAVLVAPGGTLNASTEARRTGGAFVVDCLAAQGYRAVNLTPGDFAKGLAAVAPLLKKGPFVSANLRDRAGNRVAAASVVVPAGAHKIGITGVAAAPAPGDPAAKAFAADLSAVDPVASLKDVVDDLAKTSDVRVLLVYGSPITAAAILRAYPQFQLCIVASGSASPDVIHVGAAVIVQCPPGGQAFAVTRLPGGKADGATVELRPAPLHITATLQKVYEQNHLASNPLQAVPAVPAPPAVAQTPVPERMPDNGVLPMNRSAATRGVKVTVTIARLASDYGPAKPPAGSSSFLVLATSWENIIPLTLIAQRNIPTEYLVPNLPDHLYLLVNGTHVAQLLPDAGSLPGHLPTKPLTIEKLGQVERGNVVFALPPVPINSLELRFYDFAHGHFVMRIVGAAAPASADKPVSLTLRNAVIEAAIFGVTKPQAVGGKPAPTGMHYVGVDLRARSALSTKADATAFDPKAKKGDTVQVGTVADWQDARKYAQLVVDGQYACLPLPDGSDLPPQPRFLPDLMTGGTLAFLVPDQFQSLELRCDFPNAKLSDGGVIRPEGLTLPVQGTRAAVSPVPAIASAKDAVFDVAIVGCRAATEFGGAKADEGQRFVVLDVRAKNLNKQQEFFQPKEQVRYVTAAGEQVEYDEAASYAGTHPPAEQMYIPAGEQRRFELAYRVGADETRPRVAYAAVTQGASKVLTLPPLNAQVATATPNAPAAPAPANPAPTPPEPSSTETPAPAPAPAMKPTAPAPSTPPSPATARPAMPAVPRSAPAPAAPADVTAESGPTPRPHDGPARGIEGVGLTAEQVNAAIDRGGKALWEYCKKKDAEDGVPFGQREQDVLCALALVHAEAHKKIPECDAAIRAFLTRVDPPKVEGQHAYVEGLLCMLIESYGDPEFEPKLRSAARWLVEAQGSDGTWTYSANLAETLFKQAAPTGVLQVSGGLPPGVRAEEWKRLTPWPKDPTSGDNSCTQYALLGLQSAAAAGIRMPSDVWSRALAEQRKRQGTKSGGWDYHDTSEEGGYGSMTAAGICAIAICNYQTGNKSFASDPTIVHGLGWMDANFAVNLHPKYGDGKRWLYYWLYSVERVGRMLDADFIGVHEWYPEGAAWLVNGQQGNGLWPGLDGEEKDDPRLPSSFALLFLTRATPPLKPIERQGPGALKTAAVASDNRFYVILDASGSMLDNMDGRMKFDIARDAVRSMIDTLPPNSDVALRVYGHRKSALDPGCDEDTELKIPMGALDKPKFNAALDTLRPRGKTPMALSIEDAIQDLGEVSADKPVTLLLLTDGGEDTRRPRGNPIKACQDLAKVKNVRFHIVGFDINEPDWSQQVQAMAQASGGRYWPAARGADLARSVRDAVLGIPEQFTVIGADGREVVRSARFGDSVPLGEGKYVLRTAYAGRSFEQPFYVSPGETTAVTFDASQIPAGAVAPAATATPTPAAAPEQSPPAAANWPKFCTHCGAPLKPGQKFCTKCGTPVVVK